MIYRIRNVGLGQLAISGNRSEILACYGLGSCIGLAAYVANSGLGALAHVVLPESEGKSSPGHPALYADIAVERLFKALSRTGADPRSAIFKMAGGARLIPGNGSASIGLKNACAVRKLIEKRGGRIAASDVGGNLGRTLFLYVADGTVLVSSFRGQKTEL